MRMLEGQTPRAEQERVRRKRMVGAQVLRQDVEDVRHVPVAEPAGIHRCPARLPGHQCYRSGRRAADDNLSVRCLDVVDQRPGAPVEAAGTQCAQDAVAVALGADPRPGVIRVEPRVVAVVGDERRADPAVLKELVPVHRREAPADLELAAGVEHLDPRDRRRELDPA